VSEIVCVSVNDPFVMAAWGKAQGADGKVRMLADTTGELTRALGIELDATAALGNKRCKRFSAVSKGSGAWMAAAGRVLRAARPSLTLP
jgi:peroxiredoxin 5